jgi:hypothetical protein
VKFCGDAVTVKKKGKFKKQMIKFRSNPGFSLAENLRKSSVSVMRR